MNTLTYEDVHEIIWNALHEVRGYVSDVKVVLYLLHACREGFFDSHSDDLYPDIYLAQLLKDRGCPDYEWDLLSVFERPLREFQNARDRFRLLIQAFSNLDEGWHRAYGSQLFDDILSSITDLEGKSMGGYTQPCELSRFVATISGYDGNGTLYNPFAGSGTYCTEMAGNGRFVAQERIQNAWAIGVLRLLANQMDPTTFLCGDSISQWLGRNESSLADQYDCIVATPPFGLRVKDTRYSRESDDFTLVDDVFIHDSLASLTPTGVAVGVFATSITFRRGESRELRQWYVESDRLDMVISLPSGVFKSTGIPTAVLKFSSQKARPGIVRVVDGTTFFEKQKGRQQILFEDLLKAIQDEDVRYVKDITVDQIRKKEYDLRPSRYFEEEQIVPEGFERRILSELIEPENGQRCSASSHKGKVLGIPSLSINPFEHLLDIGSLPDEEINRNMRKIQCPVLLLSRIRTLRPTFAQASEESPVYLHPNVLAFRVKKPDSLYIPSLVLAISKIALNQAEAMIPSISQSDILNMDVVLPKDLSAQEAFYLSAEREYKLSRIREFGLEELIKAQKVEYVSLIQRRKHDLNNMLGDIRNNFQAVTKYLHSKGYDSELIDEDLDLSLVQLFDNMHAAFSSMSQIINHLDDEEVYAEPEVIDLIPRLKALAAERHRNYTIRYSEDGYSLCDVLQDDDEYHAFIKFGSVNLDRVFFNIIQNAEKHGFTDLSRTDYLIDIEISHDYDSACFVIRFKNNGKPLPLGVDTRRYGRRAESAGATGGSGYGGAIVKSTVEHYGGTVELISQPDDWFPVCVELRIPHYDE